MQPCEVKSTEITYLWLSKIKVFLSDNVQLQMVLNEHI